MFPTTGKMVFFFSAMGRFAEGLREAGWSVNYVELDDFNNTGSLVGEIETAVKIRPKRGGSPRSQPGTGFTGHKEKVR